MPSQVLSANVFGSNGHGRVFAQHRRLSNSSIKKWVDLLSELMDRNAGHSRELVDACCGTGRFSIPLAQRGSLHGWSVRGVDRSSEMIAQLMIKAARLNLSNLQVYTADLLDCTFHPADVVFLSDALHLFTDQIAVLSALRRLMKGNGSLCLRVTSHEEIKKIAWLNCFPKALEADLARSKDVPQIASMLRACNFNVVCVKPIIETAQFRTDEFLTGLRSRAYSILSVLADSELETGVELFGKKLAGKITHIESTTMTAIVAQATE